MSMSSWHVANISIPLDQEDMSISQLHDLKTVGIIEEKRTNTGIFLKAYFGSEVDQSALQKEIESNLSPNSIEMLTIGKEDWANNWKQHFHPFEIAPNIIIKPSWEDYPTDNKATIVELDPGMAFGTGTHETTSLCASFLVDIASSSGGAPILDLGTGSGLLSIIAAKLTNSPIDAIDTDPIVEHICLENFKNNHCESQITFYSALESTTSTYSIVIANILLNTLQYLAHQITSRVNPEGYLILSGITTDQEQSLLTSYTDFKIIKKCRKGEWSSFLMQRK